MDIEILEISFLYPQLLIKNPHYENTTTYNFYRPIYGSSCAFCIAN